MLYLYMLRKRLAELMNSKGWNQVTLSKKADVSQSKISAILRGEIDGDNITTKTALKIADAFGITIDELLGSKKKKPDPDEIKKENEKILAEMDPELREIFLEFLELPPKEQVKILRDKMFSYINPKIIKKAIDEAMAEEENDEKDERKDN